MSGEEKAATVRNHRRRTRRYGAAARGRKWSRAVTPSLSRCGRGFRRWPCTSRAGRTRTIGSRSPCRLAAEAGIAVLESGLSELDRLTGGAIHQGVALQGASLRVRAPGGFFPQKRGQTPPLIVALDGVTDPRNLGAVVRSAAAFGATGVVVPSRRSAGVNAGAWKASAGALARLPVAQAVNLTRAIEGYKKAGLLRRRARRRGHDRPARHVDRRRADGARRGLRGTRALPRRRECLRHAGVDPDGRRATSR